MPTRVIEEKLARLQAWGTAGLACIVAMAVSTTGLMLWLMVESGQQARRIREAALSTNHALCAFKADLQVRHDGLVEFIADNPHGIPGITRPMLDQSRRNYESTLESLNDLRC